MIEDGVTTEAVLQNLKSGSEESKLSGVKMLLQLLETDSKQAVPFLQCDGLTPLVAMLRHCQGESRIQAVCVIAKLVADGEPPPAL
ncbi:hypothetical protein CYMTET_44896 [Cymbomonas tetramitiformis]|uniref:Uncharacterized protein n=1 Tax=Cymbomonas tetramitiformis TaxID=36881 RepID=A0AAE0C0J2_9CHLO|nr:hypothetical protein CYMTET_44896 [Cymbomonas tetramitiformis]